jgi:hypothetical protein
MESRTDPVDGLAWCIPLGAYASLGISVDPGRTGANTALLLNWVDKAFPRRGIDVRAAFATRGDPVDHRYEHYTHERCYGRNWLLAGTSCSQVWFPSASGVATGLVAARLAADLLKAPAQVAPLYQAFLDRVVASHSGLEWLVRDDPWSVTAADLQQRAAALTRGNAVRLGRYLDLQSEPPELEFGNALVRMYESDRMLATPVRIETASPEAQATRLFTNDSESDTCAVTSVEVPVLTRPANLSGPAAILGLVDVLSGLRAVEASADLVTADIKVQIDQFQLQGLAQWNAWASFLRNARRVTKLELVPGLLTGKDNQWVLNGQWQGLVGSAQSVSPPFSVTFLVANERVAEVQTGRADYTFVIGESILPQVAFAAVLSRLMGGLNLGGAGMGGVSPVSLPSPAA